MEGSMDRPLVVRFFILAALAGFAILMAVRSSASSMAVRVILATAAFACAGLALLYVGRMVRR
jgi:hypothetical protein